jgi:hypothetical protein
LGLSSLYDEGICAAINLTLTADAHECGMHRRHLSETPLPSQPELRLGRLGLEVAQGRKAFVELRQ